MPQHIQGKDGKFAGSVGDGNTKVPTPAPEVPSRTTGIPGGNEKSEGAVAAAYKTFTASQVKSRILAVPACPDGPPGRACQSCLAEALAPYDEDPAEYRRVKGLLFATPVCPDGGQGMACASCLAEGIAANPRAEATSA